MFRSVLDGILDATWLDDESGEDVLLGLAHTFRELAAGVDAFGELVRDDANRSSTMESSDVQRLRDALDGLHEARARLEDLMLSGPPRQLLELHAAVLATVKRLLQEMDLDERVRRQVRLLRRSRHRTPRVSFSHASPLTGYAETTPEAETQVLPLPPREDGPSPGAS
jgi:hypothetical protein